MNLAQKIVVYVTLLVVVVFLLAGGHQNVYSGSNYMLGFGGHRSYYTVRRTNWPRTIVDIVVILAAGGAGVLLFRRKRAGDEQKPGQSV